MLCWCVGFSLVVVSGLLSSCSVRASHFGGFSCKAQALGLRASVVAVPGLSSKGFTAKQEKQVWSLGQEDPQKKEMASHSNILFFNP